MMEIFFKNSLLWLLACHFLGSAAWIIDSSCNFNTAPASVAQDALQSAFSQANAGYNAITQNPQDPNYASLQRLLFTNQTEWPRVQEVLRNVIGLNTPGTNRNSPNEIIIYCDLSRVKRNDYGRLIDPDVDQFVPETEDYLTCASTENSLTNIAKGSALAYTTGLSGKSWDDHVMQIQLCAWYAKYMAKAQYKVAGRFSLYRLAAKLGTWVATVLPKWGITVMDSLSLLDNTLLHELTHTRAAGGTQGGTDDIGGANTAYGWKDITSNLVGGANNADSIAYYCLGCMLINNGSAPQPDGTLKDCPIPA